MKLIIITAPIALVLFAISSLAVNASIQDVIDATVSIGICGNGLIEGVEQCEGSNLAGRSCQSLGYDSGSLICDNACDFDVTVCSFVVTPAPGVDVEDQSVVAEVVNPTSPLANSPILIQVQRIPLDLTSYDTNQNGIIDGSELATAVGNWVDYWRDEDDGDCDLSGDGKCNLVDFSILLFYAKN